MPTEEEHGVESLILGGDGDVALDGEIGQEVTDVICVDLRAINWCNIREEPSDPAQVGLLGAVGFVLQTDDIPASSQQLVVLRTDARQALDPEITIQEVPVVPDGLKRLPDLPFLPARDQVTPERGQCPLPVLSVYIAVFSNEPMDPLQIVKPMPIRNISMELKVLVERFQARSFRQIAPVLPSSHMHHGREVALASDTHRIYS